MLLRLDFLVTSCIGFDLKKKKFSLGGLAPPSAVKGLSSLFMLHDRFMLYYMQANLRILCLPICKDLGIDIKITVIQYGSHKGLELNTHPGRDPNNSNVNPVFFI